MPNLTGLADILIPHSDNAIDMLSFMIDVKLKEMQSEGNGIDFGREK